MKNFDYVNKQVAGKQSIAGGRTHRSSNILQQNYISTWSQVVINHLYVLKVNKRTKTFTLVGHLSEGLGKPIKISHPAVEEYVYPINRSVLIEGVLYIFSTYHVSTYDLATKISTAPVYIA